MIIDTVVTYLFPQTVPGEKIAMDKKALEGTYPIHSTRRIWIFVLAMLIILDCYFHIYVYYNVLQNPAKVRKYSAKRVWIPKNKTAYYKYPLINGSTLSMDYENSYNSSYFWFKSMKHLFKDLSADATPKYPRNTSICIANTSTNPIILHNNELDQEWLEEQNSDVAEGGYFAPVDCKSAHRVAVIIPYRGLPIHLTILLSALHQLLKQQLLEYRIFVIEQNGIEKFNKGTLYNIAFLETQRFGTWDCLIFHDVDLVPRDESIPYSCPEQPTHMSAGNDSWGNSDPHRTSFGGVIAITPEQYESVNGYSNLYWDWGVEDDDFYGRLSKNYTIAKYNSSIARYTELPHSTNESDRKRTLLLTASKLHFRREDLTGTRYNLIKVTEEKVYTHILADVNPRNMPLDPKSLMQRLFEYHTPSSFGHEVFKSRSDSFASADN
ncbi:hypothetical protein PYW07_005014 [Mythimna separata]|uniref:Beta-1,4-N-acetylgalactosaminyltransferase n=1 Tax=Mythimna separata TaxID=271217 RepID=A0AAD7YEF7_MYTSE|nr:hypothetical protein PYW07_005014 [Mythimna separata]